jgi:hypothetical protein
MDMIKVREGRVIEHWALRDTDALRSQLTSASGAASTRTTSSSSCATCRVSPP